MVGHRLRHHGAGPDRRDLRRVVRRGFEGLGELGREHYRVMGLGEVGSGEPRPGQRGPQPVEADELAELPGERLARRLGRAGVEVLGGRGGPQRQQAQLKQRVEIEHLPEVRLVDRPGVAIVEPLGLVVPRDGLALALEEGAEVVPPAARPQGHVRSASREGVADPGERGVVRLAARVDAVNEDDGRHRPGLPPHAPPGIRARISTHYFTCESAKSRKNSSQGWTGWTGG